MVPRTSALRIELEAVQPVMAKADLKNLEVWRAHVGRVVQRCFALAGLTQKEAAGLLDRDPAQIARWIAGTERPQLDALLSEPRLRQPLVVALAECAGDGVAVETVVRIRRA